MGWGLAGAGLVLLLALMLVAVLASRVEFRFDFRAASLVGVELHIEVRALFGLFRRNFHLNGISFKGWLEGFEPHVKVEGGAFGNSGQKSGHSNERNTDPLITPQEMKDSVRRGMDMARHIVGMNRWVSDTLARFRCRSFVWHSQLGVYDAALTAIAAGVLWAVKGVALGLLFRRLPWTRPPDIRVQPLFQIEYFSTELSVSLETRFHALAAAAVRLAFRMMRGKGGWRYWKRQYRLFARRKQHSGLSAT